MIRHAIVLLAVTFGVTANAHAQLRHIAGSSIGARLDHASTPPSTTETITLTFGPPDAPAFMVVFAFRSAGTEATASHGIVDQTITRYMPDEARPELAIDMAGTSTMRPARLTSRSAVTTTMSFDEFVALARSESVRERAFDAELEFSSGQLRMLRAIIDRAAQSVR
jgi:hypothetical protein